MDVMEVDIATRLGGLKATPPKLDVLSSMLCTEYLLYAALYALQGALLLRENILNKAHHSENSLQLFPYFLPMSSELVHGIYSSPTYKRMHDHADHWTSSHSQQFIIPKALRYVELTHLTIQHP